MDDDEPPLDRPSSESMEKRVQNTADSNYGPWLLVSRRRGSTHGRGGGTRATHMTHSAAAEQSPEVVLSRGTDMRNIRGERRAVPSGRLSPSLITPPVGFVTEQSLTQGISISQPIASSSSNFPLNACEFQDVDQLPLSALPPVTSNQDTYRHTSPCKEKSSGSLHSKFPPSVLRSSVKPSVTPPSIQNPNPHSNLVDIVSNALKEEDMEEDGS